MPTPLETYAQSEVDRLESLESTARSAFGAAQALLGTRRSEHADAIKGVATAEAAVAAVRHELGGSEVPANASAGGQALHDALMQLRLAQAEQLRARLALLDAEGQVEQVREQLAELGTALTEARATLADTQARAQELATWTDALASGSALVELPATAAALKADAKFTDAKAKIGATLPTGLRTRAVERLLASLADDEADAAQQAALEDILDAGVKATGGLEGAVAPLERAFERSETLVRDYVSKAAGWLAEASTRLARIAARRSLTASESTSLASTTARADALVAEKQYDTALAARATAQRLLDRRVAAIYADLTITDPEAEITTDSVVVAQRAAITSAEATIAAHTDPSNPSYAANAAHLATLRSWQADVPEFAWDDLLDLTLAERLLDRLIAATPSSLLSDLDTAETAFVDALQAELDSDRRLDPANDALDQTRRALARRRETAQERARAELRGLR